MFPIKGLVSILNNKRFIFNKRRSMNMLLSANDQPFYKRCYATKKIKKFIYKTKSKIVIVNLVNITAATNKGTGHNKFVRRGPTLSGVGGLSKTPRIS